MILKITAEFQGNRVQFIRGCSAGDRKYLPDPSVYLPHMKRILIGIFAALVILGAIVGAECTSTPAAVPHTPAPEREILENTAALIYVIAAEKESGEDMVISDLSINTTQSMLLAESTSEPFTKDSTEKQWISKRTVH